MSRSPRALVLALALLMTGLVIPSGGASHGDGSYDQPNWFTWNTARIDVLIIPPSNGQLYNGNGPLGGYDPFEATPLNSYLDAIQTGIDDWREAIQMFGPAWLRDNLEINDYVVGLDIIPPAALADPEVVIHTSPNKGVILGIAIRASNNHCIIDNSRMFVTSFTYNDMYSVGAHEFGHCLGLDHTEGSHPDHDLLNAVYHHSPGNANNHRHCISNLNVAGVARTFGGLFGQASGGTASVPVNSYTTHPC